MGTQKYLLNTLSPLKEILCYVKGSGNQQTSSGNQDNRISLSKLKYYIFPAINIKVK